MTKLREKLQKKYRVGDFSKVRRQLDGIVDKRNRIVHEGDLARHQRGGTARVEGIQRREVERGLRFLDDLVNKLEGIP